MQNAIRLMRERQVVKELDQLVRAIGECKSKAEEDRIMLAELDTLRQRFADPKLERGRGREYMVRASGLYMFIVLDKAAEPAPRRLMQSEHGGASPAHILRLNIWQFD